jgi:hypothetical protein
VISSSSSYCSQFIAAICCLFIFFRETCLKQSIHCSCDSINVFLCSVKYCLSFPLTYYYVLLRDIQSIQIMHQLHYLTNYFFVSANFVFDYKFELKNLFIIGTSQ